MMLATIITIGHGTNFSNELYPFINMHLMYCKESYKRPNIAKCQIFI